MKTTILATSATIGLIVSGAAFAVYTGVSYDAYKSKYGSNTLQIPRDEQWVIVPKLVDIQEGFQFVIDRNIALATRVTALEQDARTSQASMIEAANTIDQRVIESAVISELMERIEALETRLQELGNDGDDRGGR